jgi:uncharacterized delta-60 repeat protein
MGLQSDGSIILAGDMQQQGIQRHLTVARFTPDGQLDASFGTGGTVDTGWFADATQVVVAPDGHIFVAGDDGIVSVTPNGDVDTSYGVTGFAQYPGPTFFAHGLAITDDGKAIATGTIHTP